MTDKANISLSSSDAVRAYKGRDSRLRIGFSAFSLSPLPFCHLSPVAFIALCTISDEATPSRPVLSLRFPGRWVDVEVLETIFQRVLEPFLLPPDRSLPFS